MGDVRVTIIKEYIDKIQVLNNEYASHDNYTILVADLINEIIAVLKSEVDGIDDNLVLNNNTLERDLTIIKKRLRMALSDFAKSTKDIDSLNYDLFWNSFISWFGKEETFSKFLKDDFLHFNSGWNGGTYFLDLNYEDVYREYYGVNTTNDYILKDSSLNGIKLFLEISYDILIKKSCRYDYTVETNKKLSKFKLPYKLQSGKLIKGRYKYFHNNSQIIDYNSFERKIEYSESMISSSELLDKKAALDSLVDSLQYFISIQEGVKIKEQYKSAAKLITGNTNCKIYVVIKNEIEEIMKISNEFFDIRHNEDLNKSKEKRAILNNSQFIEFLYNRVHSLISLLRLYYKP